MIGIFGLIGSGDDWNPGSFIGDLVSFNLPAIHFQVGDAF